jgi:lipopolysaccharide export system protein LptA
MTFLKRVMIAGAALLFSGLFASAALAQTFSDAFAGFGSNDGEPIEIEASELRVEDGNNTATFVGDVVVVQGDTSLKTQRLKVFYAGSGADAVDQSGGQSGGQSGDTAVQQRISRLEAAGGVHIVSKDQTARGDAASFDMTREVMVMTGQEVVLSQGPNVVVGKKLTVNLKTGQANLTAGGGNVSGSGGGRVKVRIQPNSVQDGN